VQPAEAGLPNSLPEMDGRQFRQWTELLEQRTGMTLPPERKSFLVTSVGLRMREIGCGCYQEYFEILNSGVRGLIEWATLVDRLTVHETRFFRHPSSLQLVREQAAHVVTQATDQPAVSFHLWSVGCSTGEETYTLAMVVDRCLREYGESSYFSVLGSDISQPSLAVGRTGIYPARRMKDIVPELREEYFKPHGDGRYRVAEALRKRVCFAKLNVLDIEHEPIGEMDVIYCQNVLIYFDRARREAIVNSMVEHLVPGGLLILGSGELVNWKHPLMDKVQSVHTLAYRRRVVA
jgi:type IV pilus assembly protein PilK